VGNEGMLLEGPLSCDSQEKGKIDDSEYLPSDECMQNLEEDVKEDGESVCVIKGKEMECLSFVSESTQLMDFIQQINDTCKCSTPNCNGKFSFNTCIPYFNIGNCKGEKDILKQALHLQANVHFKTIFFSVFGAFQSTGSWSRREPERHLHVWQLHPTHSSFPTISPC